MRQRRHNLRRAKATIWFARPLAYAGDGLGANQNSAGFVSPGCIKMGTFLITWDDEVCRASY
jgi:hypothetical protein